MRRTGPLAIDDLVEVVGIPDVGGLQDVGTPRSWLFRRRRGPRPRSVAGLCHRTARGRDRVVPSRPGCAGEWGHDDGIDRAAGSARCCSAGWPGPAGAAEIKLATWNLDWLTLRAGRRRGAAARRSSEAPEDLAVLRRYAALLAADVVAFQEVDGPAAAEAVFPPDQLRAPPDRATGWCSGSASRCGAASRSPPIPTSRRSTRRARGCARGRTSRCTWPGGRLRLLAVHLKQGCRQDRLTDTRPRRLPAAARRSWRRCRAGWRSAGPRACRSCCWATSTAGWTVGDAFFGGAAAATAPLLRATEGQSSPCWGGGGFIDHIIAGGAGARAGCGRTRCSVLVYRETGEEWRARLSDHCPVSVRFALPD